MLTGEDRRNAFMDAFERSVCPNGIVCPEEGSLLARVSVDLVTDIGEIRELEADEVYLCSLRTRGPKQGHGTKAMAFLTGLADEFGVHMYLDAAPVKQEDAISLHKLKDFYQRFGFSPTGTGNEMYRPALEA